ncbi:hypothetical protein ACGFNU_06910 [Spirillospora sp. NPDC048911]|uniref:hypothetical protein n=1 Tax=Spirillospora sp. NPDC048911 TaxID=3364527 RepID=UPI003720ED46
MPPPGAYGGPGTPPPFFPPPGGQQPPRGSSRGLLIALLGGGGLIVIVVIALVLAFTVFKEDKMTPSERLAATATTVSTARALAYKGTFSGGGDTLQGELKVTKGGRAAGQVSWDGDNVTVLSADDKLFVKAPKSYWSTKVTSSSAMLKDGDQWGKVSSSDLSLDVEKDLTPAALSRVLRTTSALKSSLKETKTTVQGRKALRIGTVSSTFYVTDSETPELLRYESSFPRVQVDVTAYSAATAATTIGDMRAMMGQLKDSFDSEARVSLVDTKKGLCTTNSSSCRVRGQVRPPSLTSGSTKIEIKFKLTAGSTTGRNLGDCTTSLNASSSSPTWVECRVSSSAWSSWSRSGETRYYTQAEYRVQGASESEIQALQSGLDRE